MKGELLRSAKRCLRSKTSRRSRLSALMASRSQPQQPGQRRTCPTLTAIVVQSQPRQPTLVLIRGAVRPYKEKLPTLRPSRVQAKAGSLVEIDLPARMGAGHDQPHAPNLPWLKSACYLSLILCYLSPVRGNVLTTRWKALTAACCKLPSTSQIGRRREHHSR